MVVNLIEIIFEDSALLVINKPAGLLSIQDGYDAAKSHLSSALEPQYGRLWMVHRLDKDTSGVIVLARDADTHRALNRQFANHEILKTYHAIAIGSPDWDTKIVEVPLRSGVGRRKRSVGDVQRGKPALTEFQVLQRFHEHALVAAHPKTGRTHQIRAHLYQLGFPILADPLYGSGQPSPVISRMALHAHKLTVKHPSSGEICAFVAPYPEDFNHLLQILNA